MLFWNDLKYAVRSLSRAKGLALAVILTMALGIGANAAIFSVVRGVLLRPLVNRDEHSLIYIRQSAQGIGSENATFSVPEIQDLRARIKSRISALASNPSPPSATSPLSASLCSASAIRGRCEPAS